MVVGSLEDVLDDDVGLTCVGLLLLLLCCCCASVADNGVPGAVLTTFVVCLTDLLTTGASVLALFCMGTSSMVRVIGVLSMFKLTVCHPRGDECAGSEVGPFAVEPSLRLMRRCTWEPTGPVCVRVCVCMCVCISEHSLRLMRICTWEPTGSVCVCVCVCMYVCMYVRFSEHSLRSMQICTWGQVGPLCMYVCVCVYELFLRLMRRCT
jgi:hypothetical protein